MGHVAAPVLGQAIAAEPGMTGFFQQALELDGPVAIQAVDRIDGGDHFMLSGLGQQRAVIAFRVIAEVAAEIDDEQVLLAQFLVLQILAGGNDSVGFIIGLPVGSSIQDDQCR